MENRVKVKFSSLQISYWCTIATFSGFMVAYVQSKGMPPKLIGLMLTVYMFSAFLGQIFWGRLSDKIKSNKKIFVITNCLMLILHIIVFYMPSFTLIIITYGLLGFIEPPVASNLDAWIMKTYYKNTEIYGSIRGWGSMGYAVVALFYGGLIQKFGFTLMLVVSSICILTSIAIAIFVPDSSILSIKKVGGTAGENNLKALVINRKFILLLIVFLCTGIAVTPLLQLMAIVMSNVGGNIKYVGYSMFASALAQTPFMFSTAKLEFISAKNRVLFSGILFFLSLIFAANANTPSFLLFCSILSGMGIGLFLPAMREVVFDYAPSQLYTTAQSISDAIYFSLAGIISSTFTGVLIEVIGLKMILNVCAMIQIIGIMLFVLNKNKKQEINENNRGENNEVSI